MCRKIAGVATKYSLPFENQSVFPMFVGSPRVVHIAISEAQGFAFGK
jgi:hypothetical protein